MHSLRILSVFAPFDFAHTIHSVDAEDDVAEEGNELKISKYFIAP